MESVLDEAKMALVGFKRTVPADAENQVNITSLMFNISIKAGIKASGLYFQCNK